MTRPIALITGGSRGLGRSMALNAAAAGMDVVITYQSRRDAADEVVAGIARAGGRGAALMLDTGEVAGFGEFAAALAEVLEAWGAERLDALVNNAGVGMVKPFAEVTEDDFDRMSAIHLKGVFFLTQRMLPLMRDGGRIVMITSRTSQAVKAGMNLYGPLKAGVEGLVRYLASELGPRGITVNAVAPGAVATDFNGGAVRDNAEVNARMAAATALGRVGQPDDIGAAVAGLLTGGFGWVTGQRIEVSGGQGL